MAAGPLTAVVEFIGKLAKKQALRGLTDGQLLDRFVAARDGAAFNILLQRHGPMVPGICRRLLRHEQDAEDVFQATFLLLIRKASTVRKRESVGSWLHGVAFRMGQQAKAKSAAKPTCEIDDGTLAVVDATPDFVWSELQPILDEEVNRLPGKFREAFVLCCLQGKNNAEAARLLHCPAGTVMSRVARARERLRQRLTRRGLAIGTG